MMGEGVGDDGEVLALPVLPDALRITVEKTKPLARRWRQFVRRNSHLTLGGRRIGAPHFAQGLDIRAR